ncbi:MAG: glycosyltransferase family 4 protein [Cytophagales bacterium]|nr:glycosyltransferase family 4 protein [Cytophagales bacterium]MDW8383249.1 glycosyltransferase family 4 protein [Flammeovirgaceae bacterium]
MKNILFLSTYPLGTAPGQRFRYEQYFHILTEHGYNHSHQPFIDFCTWNILYKKGHIINKVLGICRGFIRRLRLLKQLKQYDCVFIFREATLVGPPIFEFLIAKIFRKPIIYDFDDAIWLPNFSEANRWIHWIKMYSKVNYIMQWSSVISAGNEYLAEYARKQNPKAKIIVNPTTIDTEHYHNKIKDQHTEKLVIGWTGTHTTLRYLREIVFILQELEQSYDFEFLVISNQKPNFSLRSLVYIQWNKDTEIEDLLRMNVGIMPLVRDAWSEGKCGFKALQYMALGIPAIVSPIGVNTKIVDNGVNGFLCDSPQEWKDALVALLKEPQLRVRMGIAARRKVVEHYSVLSNTPNFLSLFEFLTTYTQ